jgi:hypothetical protein
MVGSLLFLFLKNIKLKKKIYIYIVKDRKIEQSATSRTKILDYWIGICESFNNNTSYGLPQKKY